MKKLLYLTGLTMFWLIANLALAAGLSVTPSKLILQTKIGDTVKENITVKNISQTPLLLNLYSDELSDIITINPNILRQEPGEQSQITITIKPRTGGILATNLSIIAEEIDRREFNAATGIKIPVQIITLPGQTANYAKPIIKGIIILLLTSGLMLLIWRLLFKKKKHFWHNAINLLHQKKPWWKKIYDRF